MRLYARRLSLSLVVLGSLFASVGAHADTLGLNVKVTTAMTVAPNVLTTRVGVDGTISGNQVTSFTVTHADEGSWAGCEKIKSVVLYDNVNSPTIIGSKDLATPLCNFGGTDVVISAAPFSQSEIRSACAGNPGTTKLLTKQPAIDMSGTLLSAAISHVPGGSYSAQTSVTMSVTCESAPPPASNPTAPGSAAHGAAAIPAGNEPATSMVAPAKTTFATAYATAKGVTVGAKPAALKIDEAALGNWLSVVLPAQQKAAVDTSHASLVQKYAAYETATKAYKAKYEQCMTRTWSTAEVLATCAPADAMAACYVKLANACVATERTALTTARTALSSEAMRLASAAGGLGVLTR